MISKTNFSDKSFTQIILTTNSKGELTMEKRTAKTIQICMGSACHLKGAPLIAQAFQAELDKRRKNQ